MVDLRKIVIIFVIAVLYAVLVQSIIEAVYPNPRYEDYCNQYERPYPFEKPQQVNCPVLDTSSCTSQKGMPEFTYNESGCPVNFECNMCAVDLRNDQEKYNAIVFIISSIFALLAIAIGLYLPVKPNNLNEWMATGFLLGGLITLFIGTARYYADMARFIRPIIILAELLIVIYLAYKKLKK